MVNIQSIKQISFVCVCVRVGCEGFIYVWSVRFFFFQKFEVLEDIRNVLSML
jgi:hypothetical protein